MGPISEPSASGHLFGRAGCHPDGVEVPPPTLHAKHNTPGDDIEGANRRHSSRKKNAGRQPKIEVEQSGVCVTETRGRTEHTVNPAVRRKLKGPDRSGDQPRFWAMNLNGQLAPPNAPRNQAHQGSVAPSAPSRSVCTPAPRIPRSPAILSQGGRQKFLCVQVMWLCPEQVSPYLVRYRLRYYISPTASLSLTISSAFNKYRGALDGFECQLPPFRIFPASRIARWNPKFHRNPPCPTKESKGLDCQRLTKEGQSAISSGIRNRCWFPSAHHQHLSDGAVISPLDREETDWQTGSPHRMLHTCRRGTRTEVRWLRAGRSLRPLCEKGSSSRLQMHRATTFGAGGEVGWLQRNRRFLGGGVASPKPGQCG
jgi:hypothetical protein